MADPADFQAKLRVLSDAYVAQLPERLMQIEQAWGQLPRNEWDEAGFETLHRMVHSLTGSGKTFGLGSLSDVARNLEEYLDALAKVRSIPGEEQRNRVQQLLGDLQQAIKQH